MRVNFSHSSPSPCLNSRAHSLGLEIGRLACNDDLSLKPFSVSLKMTCFNERKDGVTHKNLRQRLKKQKSISLSAFTVHLNLGGQHF